MGLSVGLSECILVGWSDTAMVGSVLVEGLPDGTEDGSVDGWLE